MRPEIQTSGATVKVPDSNSVPHNGALRTKKKKPQTRKYLIWVLTALVAIAIGVWAYGKFRQKPPSQLITAKVTKGTLNEMVSASGSVTAQTGAEVHIGSQITGTIKRLATDVGSQVKAGQLIVELDLPDLQDQLNQSQAALNQAVTKYDQTVNQVHQVNTQSQTALDVAKQGVDSAEQLLRVAIANLRQQRQQTASDIVKGRTGLSTAQSALVQTQAGANLQVTTAQETVAQAAANAANSQANLSRTRSLYQQGFDSPSDVDTATALDGVYQSQVRSAKQNVDLVQQKVTADLQSANDAVTAAKAALAAARSETQTVLAREADVRNATAAFKQAKANLQAAQANMINDVLKQQDVQAAAQAVTQAKALVAYNQSEVDKSFIRSPISGTVLALAAQHGETVSAGLAAPTLGLVADLKRLEIDAFVNENDIGKVSLGQIATCSVDAFPKQTFTGRIAKIASGSTIQQGVVTYDVTIGIQDPKLELKPDMTANVNIQTGTVKKALIVPEVAVQLGTKGSTINVLTTKDGQQVITPVRVVTGGTDGINIEIKSGLKEGDVIVLAGAVQGSGKAASSPLAASAGRGGGGGGR